MGTLVNIFVFVVCVCVFFWLITSAQPPPPATVSLGDISSGDMEMNLKPSWEKVLRKAKKTAVEKQEIKRQVPWRRMDQAVVQSNGYRSVSERIGDYEMARGGFSTKYRRHLDNREGFMRGILSQKPQASRYMIPIKQ